MTTWTDTLPTIDLDRLHAVFPGDTARKDARLCVETEIAHRTHGTHTAIDATAVRRAKDVLQSLPEPGEAVHIILAGNFANFDFVDAIMQLAAPAVAEELTLATLGLNRRTVDGLCRLLDAGTIGQCSLLACVYFESHDRELWNWTVAELERRGSRALAARNHAKLQLYALDDGRRLVMETSANLRSCHMAEQAVLTNDSGLYDFHRTWIDSIFRKATL